MQWLVIKHIEPVCSSAVKMMQKSVVHFQNIQELLKNAMFMKQQIDYEDARK